MRLRITPRDNERALHRDMATHAAEILEGIGAKNIRQSHGMRGQAHEVGAARMGTDPKTSVLTPFLQTHDVGNLFVMDGSSFPSSAWQNPTLTIMALAVRSTDYLLEQLRTRQSVGYRLQAGGGRTAPPPHRSIRRATEKVDRADRSQPRQRLFNI